MSPVRPLRSPFFRFGLVSLILGCALLFGSWAQKPKAPETTPSAARGRILLVTRHCEKDPAGDARDPGLSAAGRARAQALCALLAPQSIDVAFASEFKRARETAALATAREKDGPLGSRAPETVKAAESDRLFAAIDALPAGQTALVVGHSNTVPAVLAHYGVTLHDEKGSPITTLPDDEFGSLFVVTLPPTGSGAAASLLELHYGN